MPPKALEDDLILVLDRLPGESVADHIERQVREGKRTLTPLGAKLLAARRKIEESGVRLLTDEELDAERDREAAEEEY